MRRTECPWREHVRVGAREYASVLVDSPTEPAYWTFYLGFAGAWDLLSLAPRSRASRDLRRAISCRARAITHQDGPDECTCGHCRYYRDRLAGAALRRDENRADDRWTRRDAFIAATCQSTE